MKAEAGRSSSGRIGTLAIGAGIGIAALLGFWAASAQGAASKRVFEETFGSAAQPEFVQPQNIAVDYDTGEVYVIDVGTGAKTLTRWNPDGTPAPFEALGSNVIDGKGSGGCTFPPTPSPDCDQTPQNGLSFPTGVSSRREVQVAIDQSGTATDGNIYLTQRELKLVDVFAPDGSYLGQLTGFKEGENAAGSETGFNLGGPAGVAVDEDGAIYLPEGDVTEGAIHKYAPTSALPLNSDNVKNCKAEPQALALAAGAGPSDGFLFYNTGNARDTFKIDSSSCEQIGEPIALQNESTVSVSPLSGHVFVSDGLSSAEAFNQVKEIDASGPEPVEVAFFQGTSLRGYAQSKDGNRMFVARNVSKLEVFSAPLPLPVVLTLEATNVEETSATLNGSVDPEGIETKEEDDCVFEYLSEQQWVENDESFSGPEEPAEEVCAETVEGEEPVSVHVDLAGLAAGEQFHYRLSATSEAGTSLGEELTFATTVPPTIEGEQATAITDSEATIKVSINPKFYATTFHVAYGPGLETPETAVGSDGAAHPVIAPLTGLEPGTSYEWRVVATSANGLIAESAPHTFTTYRPFAPDTDCPNQALRGGLSASLPDCRAYEMVSPVDKSGGEIANGPDLSGIHAAYIQATPDGAKIAYSAEPSFGDQLSSRYYNQYIAARGEGGWANSGVNLPLGRQSSAVVRFSREINAFSEDLCSMWTIDYNEPPLLSDAQQGFDNLYRRQNCAPSAGDLETLTTVAPPEDAGQSYVSRNSVQGLSADGDAAFFVAEAKLTPEAADTKRAQVYLHLAGTPEPILVSVLPDGKAASPKAGSNNAVGGGGVVSASASGDNLQGAVSEDGERVFWSADLSSGGTGKLYLRLNPAEPQSALAGEECTEAAKACTVEVSAGSSATFWAGNTDGSAALYSEGGLGAGAAKLLRFDLGGGEATELAEKVYGLAGASEDLGRVYLVSGKDYDGAGPAEEDQPNLYLHEEGVGFTLVATLIAVDVNTAVNASPRLRATRVTPSGGAIAFQSRASLTGYDNEEASTGEAAIEVFVYSVGGGLRCASCNPAGVRPRAGTLPAPYIYPRLSPGGGIRAAAWIPTWENSLHASRLLSADGGRLFFHSFDPLLPQDTNGTVQDLYQWEAPGAGSCDSGDWNYFAANGGCLSLISSGESNFESEFWDASEDGSHVFFTTDSSLVDHDPGSIDLYDAHVDGGYPPPAEATNCEGEACQSAPPAPDVVVAATASHSGPGNVKPPSRCRAAARRAAKLARQAKRLRRRARATSRRGNSRQAKRLRGKARGRAKQARRKSRAAKRCRRAERRAAR